MINFAAALEDSKPLTSVNMYAPAFNVAVGGENQSVRVANWKRHAVNVDTTTDEKCRAIILTNMRVAQGKGRTT